MRTSLIAAGMLLVAPAAAQDASKSDALSNDLSMKTDVMIHDGDIMSVAPNGHVVIVGATPARRKAVEAALAAHGAEVEAPMTFMLRDGKLWRMDSSNAAQAPAVQ
jgi:hypothetical protein